LPSRRVSDARDSAETGELFEGGVGPLPPDRGIQVGGLGELQDGDDFERLSAQHLGHL
jgi:hypothetical protein